MSELSDLIAAARDKSAQIARLEDKLIPLAAEFAELKAAIVAAAEASAETDAKGTRRAELVTDAGTAVFMLRFYEHLAAAPGAYEAALRATKLDVVAGRLALPGDAPDWKAFVMMRN